MGLTSLATSSNFQPPLRDFCIVSYSRFCPLILETLGTADK